MDRSAVAPRRSVDQEKLLLALILLLALGLRFYQLAGSSLWSDEGNTWALVARSFGQIARAAAADIHPPGYYWLLKGWTALVGSDAWGMRSFSAVAGTLLVYLVYGLGRQLERALGMPRVALVAALVAALNPFLIYYSQEARMYQLLALASAGLVWALIRWQEADPPKRVAPAILYVGWGIVGLWTHYAFPVVLGAAGVGFLLTLLSPTSPPAATQPPSRWQRFWPFVGLNALILLAYLPWLPTAIARVLQWPKGGIATPFLTGLELTFHSLVFGPLRSLPAVQQPWLWGALLLPLLGLVSQWRQRRLWLIGVWWLAPLLLMFGLGLFSDAFLKFLLVASPAWILLTAVGVCTLPGRRFWQAGLVGAALLLAGLTLPTYYTSPTVRDNYAGIAAYLQATADPTTALVVLDAPGQQEVWRYYDPGVPIIALPQERPPNREATLATLSHAVADRTTIYALFWATDEADPDGLVEGWLAQETFQGLFSWQGNVRFVTYARPANLHCTLLPTGLPTGALFGESIQLQALCQPAVVQQVASGTVALVGLQWQSRVPLHQRYQVTVQVLDAQNRVLAQHDSEPAGGSLPTDQWPVGETIHDNHGIFIPPGTPPGSYRLLTALYDRNSGERLRLASGEDALMLGDLQVIRPTIAFPPALLDLAHTVNRALGPITLVGYDAYRKGMGHTPETPLAAGDVVEFTFYWQAPAPLPADWPAAASYTLTLGDQSLTQPLAGEAYPTSHWQAGELVRSKAELRYTGEQYRPRLQSDTDSLTLAPLPGAPWWYAVLMGK
ncbi:MAG: glycosyltransferase family 39 protein [Caldilineaceae bacterium]|nr:glycosyltransferase family 39 protein [Caldilineaceae bacterium]